MLVVKGGWLLALAFDQFKFILSFSVSVLLQKSLLTRTRFITNMVILEEFTKVQFKVTLQSHYKGQLLCSNWKITADVLKEEFLVERRIIIAILWLELLHQNHFQVQTNSKKPVEKSASASVYLRGQFTFINFFKCKLQV